MVKLAKILLALFIFSSTVAAEESGIILGVGAGYGGSSFSAKGAYNLKLKGGGFDINAMLGYKYFFTPSLGLRAYGNLGYFNLKFNDGIDTYKMPLIGYGVNADFLYNFIAKENYDIGLFVGTWLGGNTVSGNDIKTLEQAANEVGVKLHKSSFDMGLNVGLRSNLYKYFGIELEAKLPFTYSKIIDDKLAVYKIKKNYNINAKLIFSF